MSIEGISLGHVSVSYHPIPLLASYYVSRQEPFHSFLSDDRKQDSATTAKHIKRIIELFQKVKVLFSNISNIWENTDGCVKKCLCETALYLL